MTTATAGQLDPLQLAEELAGEIGARYRRYLQGKGGASAWGSNRASGLGDPCMRRVVLWRTEGEKARPFGETTAGFFTAGALYEGPVLRLLEDLGIELIKGQVTLPRTTYEIGARLDRVAVWRGMEFPAELKTTSPYVFDAVETAADIKNHSGQYVRKWYDQVQVYLLFTDLAAGLLLLWDKLGGRVKAIAIPMDYDRAQWLLDRAEAVNDHMTAHTLPPFISDPTECRKCPFFGAVCSPPLDFGPGAAVIADERLIELAEIRERTAEAAREHDAADRELKKSLRGVELGILGPFEVRGQWQRGTKYEIPEDVKRPYRFVDEKARFLLQIERVPR